MLNKEVGKLLIKKKTSIFVAFIVFLTMISLSTSVFANSGGSLESSDAHIALRDTTLPEIGTTITTVDFLGRIAAGDDGITDRHINITANILKDYTMPTLKYTMSFDVLKQKFPQLRNTPFKIILFSNENSYRNALVTAGVPSESIENMVANTGGITDGTRVWIPLYSYNDKSLYAHFLTHELTHVILHHTGLDEKTPIWIEEGLAVFNGVYAQRLVNPLKAKLTVDQLIYGLKEYKNDGGTFSLYSNQSILLNSTYNVEALYFVAVRNLIKQKGIVGVNRLIENLATSDINRSFYSVYGMTITSFENALLSRVNGSAYDLSNSSIIEDTLEVIFNLGYRIGW